MKTPSLLNEIVEHARLAEVPEPRTVKSLAVEDVAAGRLTTAQLLVTMQQLGAALHLAGETYGKLGEAAPDQLPALLEQILKAAAGAQLKAARLLAANR